MDLKPGQTYIIGEAGINHGGSMERAKQLIDIARDAGCNAVKFQKRDMPSIFSFAELSAPSTSKFSFGPTLGEHRAALEFGLTEHQELKDYAATRGIEYFSSAFDAVSCSQLMDLGVTTLKVPSCSLTSDDLIRTAATSGCDVILSTGMSSRSQIDHAVGLTLDLVEPGQKVVVLGCTSAYPCMPEEVNLRQMEWLSTRYAGDGVLVGMSGHWTGTAIDCAAVALGARVLERHITYDRAARGTDHAASLEPADLMRLVDDVREVEKALGDGIKRVYASERPVMRKLRTEKLGGVSVASVTKGSGDPPKAAG